MTSYVYVATCFKWPHADWIKETRPIFKVGISDDPHGRAHKLSYENFGFRVRIVLLFPFKHRMTAEDIERETHNILRRDYNIPWQSEYYGTNIFVILQAIEKATERWQD